ncbi:MAG: hypothetical protein JO224_13585 [Pelomonas sp.]|nr:hypothetical protein [Roseateles sp.]
MSPPSTDAMRALGARLRTPELIVFPVRHHSPASAWQLQALLAQLRPAAVLVEGPAAFTPLIPLLVHAEARMPLAVYTYAVQQAGAGAPEQRRAAYYPFCDHSPELVALRAAAAQGVPARFIDLDYAQQCRLEAAGAAEAPDDAAQSLLDERHYRRSQALAALARRLGCRDHEELWEHLFEVPAATRTLDAHLADMAAYCRLARDECSDAALRADGTLQREAEMAWHIRQALDARRDGDGPVLAVVGGFHAVALPDLLDRPVQRPEVPGNRGGSGDAASALIRYSFDRLDRLNGYAAGMTSPAWHQRGWELALKHAKAGLPVGPKLREELALSFLFDIAAELRERVGLPLPLPALTAAFEHALRLARLRERPAPVREDLLDAVTSCFVQGDVDAEGALVLAVSRRALGGQAMGRVPPGGSTPPLVRDFEVRARRQRLKIDDAQPRRLVLDLYRRAEHRVTSRLLHGLGLLGVPLATRTAGPDFVNGIGLDRLQEHWDYAHSAATEAALVEASVYGTTLPLAVANRFDARLERFENGQASRDAKTAAAFLTQACVLGLHEHLPRVAAILAQAAAADASFESLAAAAGSLGLLRESREPLEARELGELPQLLRAAFERAVYLGRELRGGDGAGVVDGLARLRELLLSEAGRDLDATLYWSMVETLRTAHEAALTRGAAAGLLYSAGRLADAALAEALAGHLNGMLAPREAVAFLRGLLQTAREAAWQQPALLQVLDATLQQWDDAAFVANLPELRLAFAQMTPKETDRIAAAVAQLHGHDDLGRLVNYELSAAQLQAHLDCSGRLADTLAADGLADWVTR